MSDLPTSSAPPKPSPLAAVLADAGLSLDQWAALDPNARRAYWMLFGPQRAMARSRLSDFEEHEGEAGSRGLDHRGFNLGAS